MSIITARTMERLAATTPQETLEMMRRQLIADQLRNAAALKKRMEGDMADVDFALNADVTNGHKRGFE